MAPPPYTELALQIVRTHNIDHDAREAMANAFGALNGKDRYTLMDFIKKMALTDPHTLEMIKKAANLGSLQKT